ncbi:hypothetical protein C2845_PM17G03990 [Panicum miliaceum]|uniref:Dirigent protein n=1 Tax=Panicum miliaceum TaxID=4540 RepID=A0A3L6Q2J6_PANMI|nr:hypothetical protein C2845_PM17G03990 [Panicum miliaceum]
MGAKAGQLWELKAAVHGVHPVASRWSLRRWGPVLGSSGGEAPGRKNEWIRRENSFNFSLPPLSISDLVTSCLAMSFHDSSTVLQQGFEQRVAQFKFYMHPRWAGPNMNQRGTVSINAPNRMGETIVNDWIITEGSDINSMRLARAQGVHWAVGFNNERWYVCVNISFEDDHFRGSTLELHGFWEPPFNTMEWTVTGGTGQFRFAQGFLIGKKYAEDENGIGNRYTQNNKGDVSLPAVSYGKGGSGPDLHLYMHQISERWYASFNIVFEDGRGSTLEIRGAWDTPLPLNWAVLGGTGQFTEAQGVLYGTKLSEDGNGRVYELTIRVFYRPIN